MSPPKHRSGSENTPSALFDPRGGPRTISLVRPIVPATDALIAGRYRLERSIGEGGMGCVYAARHVELGTHVALKTIHRDALFTVHAAERFKREARVVASLESEHVARVFDFGTLESGAPFVVMELLEGADLDTEIVRRGPLPAHEAVPLFLQACEALAEAHANGVIHRDLKPKNLFLVRRRDGRQVIKVLDFGIAKETRASTEEVSLTRVADVLGTPRYSAPEQLRSAKGIDARADVWGIGVTLYEVLTGDRAFEGETEGALVGAVLTKDPVPVRERCAEVPTALADVVHRCLAKDPAQRFANMFELAAALEASIAIERGSSGRIRTLLTSRGMLEPTIDPAPEPALEVPLLMPAPVPLPAAAPLAVKLAVRPAWSPASLLANRRAWLVLVLLVMGLVAVAVATIASEMTKPRVPPAHADPPASSVR